MFHAIECQIRADHYARISREWRECYNRAVTLRDATPAELAHGYAALAEQAAHSFGFYSEIAADFYRMAREAMGV